MSAREALVNRVNNRLIHDCDDARVSNIERLLLVYDDGCPACIEAKEYLKERIESGEILLLSSDDDETIDILNSIEIKGLPILVARFSDGTYEEVDLNG